MAYHWIKGFLLSIFHILYLFLHFLPHVTVEREDKFADRTGKNSSFE
jgi:hypothetical protein